MSRQVNVGGVLIGNGAPVSIQSMTSTDTKDVSATLAQINELAVAGADIVRLAVADKNAAAAFCHIKKQSPLPLVADIHFDYQLALLCIEGGADKIRINPGNIGSPERVRAVATAAKKLGIPIRVGVNLGSAEKEFINKYGHSPRAMVESAKYHASLLEQEDFHDIVISLKASDVKKTVEAYRIMAKECDYPLHIGVTEAGTVYSGIIKSAAGIGSLLLDGIGDTLRVSLTAHPVEEIKAAKALLAALSIREMPELISCPTCGRCKINLFPIAEAVEKKLQTIKTPIKVAVMGCAVNGPGEASHADIGIAGGDKKAVLFKKGEIIGQVPEADILKVLFDEIAAMTGEK